MLICAWSLFPLLTHAAEDEGDGKALQEVREVVKQLQARYEKTKDLQADFTQKTVIEGFERSIASSGKVYIKKPGRLRWNYLDPSVEDIYVNRDDVKVYVPEHKQVLVGKLTQMAASRPRWNCYWGLGWRESFDIEPTPADVAEESGCSRSCQSRVKVRQEIVATDRTEGFRKPISFARSLSMKSAAMSRILNFRRFNPTPASAIHSSISNCRLVWKS